MVYGVHHDTIAGYVANEHIDWTNQTDVDVDLVTAGEIDAAQDIHSETLLSVSAAGAGELDPHVYINTTTMAIRGALSQYVIECENGSLVLLGSGGATISLSTIITLENETRVAGDLLPGLSGTYNLGTPTDNLKWVNGYFSGDVSAATFNSGTLSGNNSGDDPNVVSFAGGLAMPALDSGKYLTNNGAALSWATVDLSAYLPLAGGTMTGSIKFGGYDLILDADLDTIIGSSETGGDHIHFNLAGTEVFHMHEDCFQAVDACGQFVSDEALPTTDFSDQDDWDYVSTGHAGSLEAWGVPGMQLKVVRSGTGPPVVGSQTAVGADTIKANRNYFFTITVSAFSNTSASQPTLSIGAGTYNPPSVGTFSGVINSGASTAAPKISHSATSNSTMDLTYTALEIRLLPATNSTMGDLDVLNGLTVTGALTATDPTFSTLTLTQNDVGSGEIPNLFTLTGGDLQYLAAANGAGGVITFGTGGSGLGSPNPIPGGNGGGLTVTTGDGGVCAATGPSHGDGGDINFVMGSKGGTKSGEVDGRFHIDDGTTDMFSISTAGLGFWGVRRDH
jgi:hypothetical protein